MGKIRARTDEELAALHHFTKETLPFQNTLKEVVAFQFPDAGSKERNMFLIQFSVYCNSLHETKYLAQKPMDAAWKIRFLDFIPPASAVAADQSIFCPECGAVFMALSAEELAFNSQSKSYVKMPCEENNILTATVLLIQCYGDTLSLLSFRNCLAFKFLGLPVKNLDVQFAFFSDGTRFFDCCRRYRNHGAVDFPRSMGTLHNTAHT